jgi:hypothetical protein
MSRRSLIIAFLGAFLPTCLLAQEDPGKAKIGQVTVTVYHATNGDPKLAGARAKSVTDEVAERLGSEARLRFKNYSLLGSDTQPLLRSYESWAQPLKPSDEVMVRFEAQGKPTKKTAILDLELWLGRKKIVKTDARLEGHRPLLVLGPEWRGGRLVISVALAQEAKKGS